MRNVIGAAMRAMVTMTLRILAIGATSLRDRVGRGGHPDQGRTLLPAVSRMKKMIGEEIKTTVRTTLRSLAMVLVPFVSRPWIGP